MVVKYNEELAEDSGSVYKHLTSISDDILHLPLCRSDLASVLRQVGRLVGRPEESQTMRLTSGNATNPECGDSLKTPDILDGLEIGVSLSTSSVSSLDLFLRFVLPVSFIDSRTRISITDRDLLSLSGADKSEGRSH
jgi:hypothetical protein